ncbi:MAG: hypothetical protein KAI64_00690, partial [Thermoplasmata archaeon]|nr:hypothetical protein [Thermoplasmata archaeon]
RSDIVVGSKRHVASMLSYPWQRRWISYLYNLMVRIIFAVRISDTQAGIKVFKRAALDILLPRILVKRYAFDLELLTVAHHYGYKIVDAPVVVEYRRGGNMGRIGFGDMWHVFKDTVAVFYRMYVMRFYLKRLVRDVRVGRLSVLRGHRPTVSQEDAAAQAGSSETN